MDRRHWRGAREMGSKNEIFHLKEEIKVMNLKEQTINFETDDIFIKYSLTKKQKRYIVIKRIVDFIISFTALIVLAVPFAVIAIIQKITAPKEPIFFHQTRIGKNGLPFLLTKFRSMKSSAPHDCPTKDFSNGEQYITKWGRFLRNSSIDELPQLFQVLAGKMSLIGPRPLIPEEGVIHEMRKQAGVYQLRPGMTGWAQVNGRDFVDDEEKVEFDCEYLENLGLRIDVKIAWMTVKKVLRKADIKEEMISEKRTDTKL